jgi:hypothetical protein
MGLSASWGALSAGGGLSSDTAPDSSVFTARESSLPAPAPSSEFSPVSARPFLALLHPARQNSMSKKHMAGAKSLLSIGKIPLKLKVLIIVAPKWGIMHNNGVSAGV